MDCSVCLESFNQDNCIPKVLSCGHTFCSKCLTSLVLSHKGLVTCPVCKRQQPITDVSKLITNYSILNLEFAFQKLCGKEKGPDVSAGHCDEHGEHKLFRCNSCDVWICHVCTVIKHPVDKCDVISIKEALAKKKKEIRVQIQQNAQENEILLFHFEIDGFDLYGWDDAQDHHKLEQEYIKAKFKEFREKVDNARQEFNEVKDQGLTILNSLRELQADLVGSEKLEDIDVCAQRIGHLSECRQEWLEGARKNDSWKSGVSNMRNLQMVSSFTLELTQGMTKMSSDEMEDLIGKSREMFMKPIFSKVPVYVVVEVYSQKMYAQVRTRSTNSTVLGDLIVDRPPPEACIMKLSDLMAKFPLVYVEAKAQARYLYFNLGKDTKGCFRMDGRHFAFRPKIRRHLLIPMGTLLTSGRVWFKHWFENRFSNLQVSTSKNSNTGLATYLLPFQCEHPPPGSFIITVDMVAMLRPIVLVTFDPHWNGKSQGYPCIQLFGSVQCNIQFQLLSCGDDGHTYRRSPLLSVENKGRPGEKIIAGDHDGAGGKAVLPDFPVKKITARPVTAGLVASKPQSAQFVIYTRDLPGETDPHSIGRVIDNLPVMEKAAKVGNIRNATLHDCWCFWNFFL